MKSGFITIAFMLFYIASLAQSQAKPSIAIQNKLDSEKGIYQLFPTKNYWTFIKLDTRNGKMWQVHFSVSEDKNTGELVLNSIPLVNEENEVKGRFTLYPTENIYNFLLLDQINGIVTQVQWSMEPKKRGIVSILKSID